MADEIERLAMEELLRETKRAKERADVMGAMGWQKGIASPNKTFLANTLVSTLRDYRHLDRDRKQRAIRDSSPQDDRKDSYRQSDVRRNGSRRRHSPEHGRKSESKGKDDRGSFKRRKESPERKRKSSFEDNRSRTSMECEKKDLLIKSPSEESKHDGKRSSQKFDKKYLKQRDSSEIRMKNDKIRNILSDGEFCQPQSKDLVNSELFKIDPATIPLPDCKEPVNNLVDKQKDLTEVKVEENNKIDNMNVEGNVQENTANNGNGKNKAEKEIFEIETNTVNIKTEEVDLKQGKGYKEREISDVVDAEDMQSDITKSLLEKETDDVRKHFQENINLDGKINEKKKELSTSKSYSVKINDDLSSINKHKKVEKHRRQKEMKKSKFEKDRDKQDKGDKVKRKESKKNKICEERTEIGSGLEVDKYFDSKKVMTEAKNKGFIEGREKSFESHQAVDQWDKGTDKSKVKDQKLTDVINDTKDTEKSKYSDSEQDRQKRKRKKDKSGHHHKHKKHKKSMK